MSSSCKCGGNSSELSELTNAILDVAAIAVGSYALVRFVNFTYDNCGTQTLLDLELAHNRLQYKITSQ